MPTDLSSQFLFEKSDFGNFKIPLFHMLILNLQINFIESKKKKKEHPLLM